jgi:hypothetical protein
MWASAALGVDHHDYLAFEQSKCHQPLLAVSAADVLAGNCEVVPDFLAPLEVEAVILEISPALGFVPGSH